MTHADTRYLEAKRSVDERALSRQVNDRFLESLPADPTIFEVGCGTGTMVPRLLDWGVRGTYLGVDRDRAVIAFARDVRPSTLRYSGQEVVETRTGFQSEGLSVSFRVGDAMEAFREESGANALIASGFADLLEVSDLLAVVETALQPGGIAYLPITFDGGTIFQPDHPADQAVERAYHRAIADLPGRDPWAGRHLINQLRTGPGALVAVDSSDWIVRPRPTGGSRSGMLQSGEGTDADGRDVHGYPFDEAYFLGCILDFVEKTIEDSSRRVERLDDWLETRREQLAAGTLTYVAHQYDLLYRRSPD